MSQKTIIYKVDGLVVKAEAVEQLDQASLILEQKNRIEQIQKDLATQQAALNNLLKRWM